MFRNGIVEKTDAQTARIKVRFPDMDNIISDWLPVIMPCAYQDRFYSLPLEKAQVVCIMDENFEEGYVLGSIYSEADPTPISDLNKVYMEFKDGSKIFYDKENHKLNTEINGSIEAVSSDEISLSAPEVNINCLNLNVVGNTNQTGNILSSENVSDSVGSMSEIRSGFNDHDHIGYNGIITSKPQQGM